MSFAALHGARGYCLFDIESVTRPDGSLYPSTAAIAGSMRVLSALAGGMPRLCEKPMQAVGQEEYAVYQTLDFDGWTVMIRFTNPAPASAGTTGTGTGRITAGLTGRAAFSARFLRGNSARFLRGNSP